MLGQIQDDRPKSLSKIRANTDRVSTSFVFQANQVDGRSMGTYLLHGGWGEGSSQNDRKIRNARSQASDLGRRNLKEHCKEKKTSVKGGWSDGQV